LLLQLAASVAADGGVGKSCAAWLVALGYSLLMAKEFFVGAWLRPRLVLYAVSHMLVMPLILLWVAQMAVGDAPLPAGVELLLALSFLSGFSFEIGRKTRGAAEEREGVDSYTKSLGPRLAPTTVLLLVVGQGCLLYVSLSRLGPVPVWAVATMGAAVAFEAWAVVRFLRARGAASGKPVEGATGLAMLIGYLVLVATLAATRGLVLVS
jgi:4-hydroxybenzoate polyprenyltransferase